MAKVFHAIPHVQKWVPLVILLSAIVIMCALIILIFRFVFDGQNPMSLVSSLADVGADCFGEGSIFEKVYELSATEIVGFCFRWRLMMCFTDRRLSTLRSNDGRATPIFKAVS